MKTQNDLAACGIVVPVRHGAFRRLLPAVPRGVGERPAELCCECDVVIAASPPEVAVWLVT